MVASQQKLVDTLKDAELVNKKAINLARRLSEIHREIAELKGEISRIKAS